MIVAPPRWYTPGGARIEGLSEALQALSVERRPARDVDPAAVALGLCAGGTDLCGSLVPGLRRALPWEQPLRLRARRSDPVAQREALGVRIDRAVQRAVAQSDALCLTLSGGLDARLVAQSVARLGEGAHGLDVVALTFGWGGERDRDAAWAPAVAEAVGLPHRWVSIGPPEAPLQWLERGLELSCGAGSPADRIGGRAATPTAGPATPRLILSGFGGDALLGPAPVRAPRGWLAGWLGGLREDLAARVLTPAARAQARAALASSERRIELWLEALPAGAGRDRLARYAVRQGLVTGWGLWERARSGPVAAPLVDPDVLVCALGVGDRGDLRPGLLRGRLATLPCTPWGLAPGISPSAARLRQERRRRRWTRHRARLLGRPQPSSGWPWDRWLREDAVWRSALDRLLAPVEWAELPGVRPQGPERLWRIHLSGRRNLARPLLWLAAVALLRRRLRSG